MMRFKLTGTAIAAFAFLATAFSAQAADIPRPIYKGHQPVIAYYNWTGFYVGINGGYGWGTSDWNPAGISPKPKGGLIGGTIGYNYQIGSVVWGLEGDIDWADVKGNSTCAVAFTCETKNEWLATFRGRVGYAFDRWLPYFTGGGAYGAVKATIDPLGVSSTKDQLGWTVGAGLEYAFLSNWSAKIEYLYVDLGNFNTTFAQNVSLKENIVRAGLNYKFSGPIFSRY